MEKSVGSGDQKKIVDTGEKYHGMCEKCCDAGREISKYVDIVPGVPQACTLSPNTFKICTATNDLTIAVAAAKQKVTVGEDTVSGLMFADDFVGNSETPEGLQKQKRRRYNSPRK